jgi:hypothetical protein
MNQAPTEDKPLHEKNPCGLIKPLHKISPYIRRIKKPDIRKIKTVFVIKN